MSIKKSALLTLGVSAAAIVLTGMAAYADDTEIFNVTATSSPSTPNILFILDTSGSMGSGVYTTAPYNASTTYTNTSGSPCDANKIYYEKGSTTPTCGSVATRRQAAVPPSPSFDSTALKCDAANTGLASTGIYGGNGIGDNAIRWTHAMQSSVTTNTPSNSTRSRTVTYTYSQTVVTQASATGTYTVKSGKITSVTAPSIGTATQTSNTSTSPVSSNGNWGATTVTATGSATTANSSSDTYVWSTELTAPASSTTTSSSNTNNGTPTTTTASGTWTAQTPQVGTPSYSPSLPVKNQSTSKSNGTYSYSSTATTTTITPWIKIDTETETTPVVASSTTTTSTYTVSDVECDGDKMTGSGTSHNYPNNVSPSGASEWTVTKANSYWDTGGALQQYTMYSGNYLNYLQSAQTTYEGTRIQVMQQAVTNLMNNMTGVNVGLMRYSDNSGDSDCTSSNNDPCAKGGMVTYAMSSISTDKSGLQNTVNSYTANGWTPLSETLYEAYLYYSGGAVNFGNSSKVYNSSSRSYVSSPSVAASRTNGSSSSKTYQSPIISACQKNYVVYLTDGLPTQDNQADSLIKALPSFSSLGGACDDTSKAPYGSGWGPGNNAGDCLGALAQYMYHADLSSSLTGNQGVASYFIGFGSDFVDSGGQLNDAFTYLDKAATRGGGAAYSATNSTALTTVLTKIVNDAIVRNTSFAAPGVAVNAFNRTQNLNDLYMSLFQPGTTMHWPGNIKKYHVQGDAIVDQNGNDAVDPATGFFYHSAKSFWTSGDPDGANTALISGDGDGESVPAGGAAHKLPAPLARNVYTYISSTTRPSTPVDLTTNGGYAFNSANSLLTPTVLGDSTLSSAATTSLINWARGQDIDDTNNPNGITTDARSVMGDPVHARPAVVVYGGTATDPDTVVFAPTNDGYLHAIGSKDNDGVELWSFIPQELLSNLKALHDNNTVTTKHYALDGDVTTLKIDVNNDGIVDASAGDRVIIIVGQGRGGSHYYALDVTDKTKPKFMWSLGAADLPGISQAWSTPTIAKVNVGNATQNSRKLALIFGGGYDPAEENTGYRATNSFGNHLYMVDAFSGALLWSASSSGADLNLNRSGHAMDHAIPSPVTVIDLDGDGYADRMYVGDMAGQLWRFDIFNGQAPATLVTGGVIASLGTHDDTTHSDADNRRFYNQPDVAAMTPVGAAPYFNIGIGSGYRGHPLNTVIQDRFYAVRDKQPYLKFTQATYNVLTVLHDSDLTDITTNVAPTLNPITTNGWKLLLTDVAGQKVLSKSLTLNGTIYFTTYIPSTSTTTAADGCSQASAGTNRLYAVKVTDGSPANCSTATCTTQDRFETLEQGGIAPGVEALYLGTDSNSSSSSSSSSAPPPPPPSCSGGGTPRQRVLVVGQQVVQSQNFCGFYKTYWKGSSKAGS